MIVIAIRIDTNLYQNVCNAAKSTSSSLSVIGTLLVKSLLMTGFTALFACVAAVQLILVISYKTWNSNNLARPAGIRSRSSELNGVPPPSPFWSIFNKQNTSILDSNSRSTVNVESQENIKKSVNLYPWESLKAGDKDSQKRQASLSPSKPINNQSNLTKAQELENELSYDTFYSEPKKLETRALRKAREEAEMRANGTFSSFLARLKDEKDDKPFSLAESIGLTSDTLRALFDIQAEFTNFLARIGDLVESLSVIVTAKVERDLRTVGLATSYVSRRSSKEFKKLSSSAVGDDKDRGVNPFALPLEVTGSYNSKESRKESEALLKRGINPLDIVNRKSKSRKSKLLGGVATGGTTAERVAIRKKRDGGVFRGATTAAEASSINVKIDRGSDQYLKGRDKATLNLGPDALYRSVRVLPDKLKYDYQRRERQQKVSGRRNQQITQVARILQSGSDLLVTRKDRLLGGGAADGEGEGEQVIDYDPEEEEEKKEGLEKSAYTTVATPAPATSRKGMAVDDKTTETLSATSTKAIPSTISKEPQYAQPSSKEPQREGIKRKQAHTTAALERIEESFDSLETLEISTRSRANGTARTSNSLFTDMEEQGLNEKELEALDFSSFTFDSAFKEEEDWRELPEGAVVGLVNGAKMEEEGIEGGENEVIDISGAPSPAMSDSVSKKMPPATVEEQDGVLIIETEAEMSVTRRSKWPRCLWSPSTFLFSWRRA